MDESERRRAASLTLAALPVYSLLPFLAYVLDCLGLFPKTCGWTEVFVYLFLVEFCVFLDHYYMLHRWRHWKHNIHHFFKLRIDHWASFAFYPFDGLSQGLPVVYVALLVPVTSVVVYMTILAVGIWTLFIHTNTGIRVPGLLGYEHHLIHHQFNWYNFGLCTWFFDKLYGTLRHPE